MKFRNRFTNRKLTAFAKLVHPELTRGCFCYELWAERPEGVWYIVHYMDLCNSWLVLVNGGTVSILQSYVRGEIVDREKKSVTLRS